MIRRTINPRRLNEKLLINNIKPPIIGMIPTRKSGIKSYQEIFFSKNLLGLPFFVNNGAILPLPNPQIFP